MEKEICRRQITREGIGCVWVFMNMFDFRHGASNHKLLLDKKRGSKRITVIETKVEKQLTSESDYKESEVGIQSVQKLIDDEIEEKTREQCDFECRGGGGVIMAKNRKKRSKTLSKSSDDDHAEKSNDHCPRNEVDSINDDSEEKFSELIKRLIAQKEAESCNNLVDSKQGSSPNIDESSPCSTQTIVILKPEPNGLDVGSSPGTPYTTSMKAKNGRFGSFILRRISRRLRKNPCNAQQDSESIPDALSSNMSCSGEDVKEESIDGSEDNKKKKSMCGIYIAAKKHLSEMFAEGEDIDAVDHLPDKEVPRILGKILALPEFTTPESSPRMTSAHDFVGHHNIRETLGSDTTFPGGVSDIDKEKEEKKTVLDSLSEPNSSSTIRKDEKVETLDEEQSSSLSSPPSSSLSISECQEKSSPVSVLEPFFMDDETSPSSSKFSSGMPNRRMQPLRIIFDEPESPRTDKDKDVETTMDDRELAFAYIQSVVKSSELNWEELLVRSFYSEQVLEQALMDDIEFFPTKLCTDQNLLFDCINEVVSEFSRQGPWISLVKPDVLLFPDMENAVEVVQEEVYWHLLPLPSPHTLDQIVWKDFAKKGRWMDLRFDIGCIGFEASEIILDELLEELVTRL